MPTTYNWQRAYGFDIVAVTLLVWAAHLLSGTADPHRYAYYETLRIVVFLAWALSAFRFWTFRCFPAVVLAALIAWLFNPIFPITMRKWQWQSYDHGTMLFSVVAAITLAAMSIRVNRNISVQPVSKQ